tara:strand:- start:768 stop:1352 length:585 start_codon:yes stop_codon:yes gene_type:complete
MSGAATDGHDSSFSNMDGHSFTCGNRAWEPFKDFVTTYEAVKRMKHTPVKNEIDKKNAWVRTKLFEEKPWFREKKFADTHKAFEWENCRRYIENKERENVYDKLRRQNQEEGVVIAVGYTPVKSRESARIQARESIMKMDELCLAIGRNSYAVEVEVKIFEEVSRVCEQCGEETLIEQDGTLICVLCDTDIGDT